MAQLVNEDTEIYLLNIYEDTEKSLLITIKKYKQDIEH